MTKRKMFTTVVSLSFLLFAREVCSSNDTSPRTITTGSVLQAFQDENMTSASSPHDLRQDAGNVNNDRLNDSITFTGPEVGVTRNDTHDNIVKPLETVLFADPVYPTAGQSNKGTRVTHSTSKEGDTPSPKLFVTPEPIFLPPRFIIAPVPQPVTARQLSFRFIDDSNTNLSELLQIWQAHVCGEKGLCSTEEFSNCAIDGVACSPCRCDRNCTLYKDCCLDKYVMNQSVITLQSSREMSCVPGGVKQSGKMPLKSYYMVDLCPKRSSSGFTELDSRCESKTDKHVGGPVYSPVTDTHYKNSHCASCNGEGRVVKWQTEVVCRTNLNYSKIHTPKSFFEDSLTNDLCNVLFLPPVNISARECKPLKEAMIGSCPKNYPGKQVREACEIYLSPIEVHSEVYKNVLCAVCHGELFPREVHTVCDTGAPVRFVNPTSRLTNYDEQESTNSRLTPSLHCLETEVFDIVLKRCRPLFCPPGRVATQSSCLDLFTSAQGLGYTLHFVLIPECSPHSTLPNNILTEDIFFKYRQYTEYMLLYANVGRQRSEISIGYTFSDQMPSLQILNITVTMHIVTSEPLPRDKLETSLIDFVVKGWYYYPAPDESPILFKAVWLSEPRTPWVVPSFKFKVYQNYTVETKRYEHQEFGIIFPRAYYTDSSAYIVVSEVLQCKQIELTRDEYDGNRSQLITVKQTGIALRYGQFISGEGNGVRICTNLTGEKQVKKSIVSSIFESNKKNDLILKSSRGPEIKATLACSSISQFFLLLTFLVYLFRPAYRDIVGQNNMAFIANVFCLQLFFQLLVSLDLPKVICVAFGAVIHYLWLSSFLWLLVSVFVLCRILLAPSESYVRSFKGWIWAVCQGLPLVVLGIYIAINIGVSNNIGYDVKNLTSEIDVCFISTNLGFALSFVSPIGIFLCLNLCLHGRICWSIGKEEEESQERGSYIRLSMSYLKITLYLGVTWIFTTLAIVINMSFLIYFTLLLHAGVGIVVFATLVDCMKEGSKRSLKPRINSDAVFYSVGDELPTTPVPEKTVV